MVVNMNQPQRTSITHKEWYFHFRNKDLTDEEERERLRILLGDDKPQILNIIREFRFSGGTVFARLEENGWHAAISVCSRQDQFCRATGRNVARRRYFNHPDFRIGLGDKPPSWEIAKQLYDQATLLLLGENNVTVD